MDSKTFHCLGRLNDSIKFKVNPISFFPKRAMMVYYFTIIITFLLIESLKLQQKAYLSYQIKLFLIKLYI